MIENVRLRASGLNSCNFSAGTSMVLLVLVVFLLLCPYHSVSVANLDYFETLSHVSVTSSIKRAADGTRNPTKYIRFQAFDRQFDLTVTPGTHLMAEGFRARLINEDGSSSTFHFDRNQIFSGHMSDRPDVRAHAHKEETLWSVQIFDHDNVYIVEPAWRLLTPADNPKNDTMIAYRASDLNSDSFNGSQFCGTKSPKKSETYQHLLAQHHGFRPHKQDYTFYKGVCRGSHASCIALMFASVNFADNIYSTSKFVGTGQLTYWGIGVRVGEICIYKAFSKQPSDSNHTHFNENITWTIDKRLELFGKCVNVLTYKKSYCAHHLFTDYPYPNGTLGMANFRSLCHPGFELGHLFGSDHDPHTEECFKTEQFGGRFLMHKQSVSGKYPNNLKFSPCSLRQIGLQIPNFSCLVPRSTVPFCGNGAVEDGEYCDASSHGMADLDPCCDKYCKLRENATCSDANHFCCMNCMIAPANTPCLYGEPVDCTEPSFCTGHECSCPKPVSVPDGTPCPGLGQCYSGICLGFCSTLSRNKNVRLQACMCRTNDNGAACKSCCFDTENKNGSDSCKVYSIDSVVDGTPCYMGFCKSGVCEPYEESTIKRFASFMKEMRQFELEMFVRNHFVLCSILIILIIWVPAAFLIYRADASEKSKLKPKAIRRRRTCRHRENRVRPSVQNTDSGLFLTSQVMDDKKSVSMEAETYSQTIHRLSGSFLSFISEAGRIFTGRTTDSHIAAVMEEARLQDSAVDQVPIIVVNKATRSESENVQISVGGKVGLKVVYEDSVAEDREQSDLASKSFSDLANQLYSDLDNKSHSDLASQLHSDLADKSHSDLASQLPSDLANNLHNDLWNTSHSDLGKTSHSDLGKTSYSDIADRLPSNLENKVQRVLIDKLRSDVGVQTQSDVAGSSQAGSRSHNTK